MTAVVAIVAAGFVWVQVRQAKQLREEQAKPFVVVKFELSAVSNQAINLVVENIGKTLARDVRIAFDRPLESAARSRGIHEAKLFKDGIPVMPPGMRLETLFDFGPQRKDSSLPMTYRATVSYQGVRRKREDEEYVLDMEVFYGLDKLVEYGIHDAAKSLSEIHKTLRSWSSSGRLKVSARDEDYDSWSDGWQFARAGKYPSLSRNYPAGRPSPSKFNSLREPLWKRAYWLLRLRVIRLEDHREDRRLERIGRPDLVIARKQERGES